MDPADVPVHVDSHREYSATSDDSEAQIALIFDIDGRILQYLPHPLWKLKSAVSVKVNCCFLQQKPSEPFDFSKVAKIDLSRDKELECLSISVSEMLSLKEVAIRCYTMHQFPQDFLDIIDDSCNIDPNNLRLVDSGSSTSRVIMELLFGLFDLNDHNASVNGTSRAPKNLEKLAIFGNERLKRLSDTMCRLRSLKELHVESCGFEKLPDAFGELCNLQKLTLKNNLELASLGSSFEKLESLEILCIENCSLKSLPDKFHELAKLSNLTLACNMNLTSLCPSFGNLKLLRYLFISNSSLSSLPNTFGSLSKLEELTLLHNNKLKSLSKISFGKLSSLRRLRIMNCGIKELPKHIGDLSNLQILTLSENSQLETLPSSFGKLKSLKDLQITSCGIKSLPESFKNLPSLQSLDLSSNCLESFSRCIDGLQKLESFQCSVFQDASNKKGNSMGHEDLQWTRRPAIKVPLPIFKQGKDAIKSYVEKSEKQSIYADTINVVDENGDDATSLTKMLCKISLRGEATESGIEDGQLIPLTSQNDAVDNSLYRVYKVSTPVFLPSSGLVVLVCNMDTAPSDLEKALNKWLITVAAKSESVRMLVIVAYPEKLIKEMHLAYKKQMEVFLHNVLKNLQREVQLKLDKAKNNLVATKTLGLLCSKINSAAVTVEILNVKTSVDSLKRLKKLVLPKLQNPDEMPSIWVRVMHEILTRSSYFLKMEEVQEIYKSHCKDTNYTDLPYILRYLKSRSQIIWLESNSKLCDIVFHSPAKIFGICEQILCKDHAWELQEGYEGQLFDMQLKNELRLNHPNLDPIVVIEFLMHFNLVSPMKKYGKVHPSDQTYIVPSNFANEEQQILRNVKRQILQCTNHVCFHLSFIGCTIPNSFFETCSSVMVATVYGLATLHPDISFWSKGLFVRHAGKILSAECKDNLITLTAASTSPALSPWFLLHPVLSDLQEYFCASWGGAPPQATIQCPACERRARSDAATKIGAIEFPLEDLCFNFQASATTTVEMSNESEENLTVTCRVCRADVPRSLCAPISTDKFSASQQRQIENFYRLHDGAACLPVPSSTTNEPHHDINAFSEVVEAYSMQDTDHGVCLIINNKNFPVEESCRHGSEIDVERLQNTFTKLGYKVEVRVDQTADNMLTTLTEFSKGHEKCDSFVCCIMSHGNEMGVSGCDDIVVSMDALTKPFDSRNCSSLAGKPKLFFINACQGSKMQLGASSEATTDAAPTEQPKLSRIPEDADFLIAFSSVFGYASMRFRNTGSVFMQTLCDVLSSYSHRCDLKSMLTEVNNLVSKKAFTKGLQLPVFTSTLRKLLYFRPMEKRSNDEQSKLKKEIKTGSGGGNCNCDCCCCKIGCHSCCRKGNCNNGCSGCRNCGCLG